MNQQVGLKGSGPAPSVAGSDDIERAVAMAWRRILGKKPGDRAAASVFGMRIGSRPVYRFLAEVEKATGVSLPFTALMQAPTLAAFTELVRLGRAPDFEPLIPFNTGDDRPPLFIFPGIGGSVFQLLELARGLSHRGDVYLNQHAGLDGKIAPHETIADMVAFQVWTIRRRQPHGPYLLLGYSLGSLLALEVARCLIGDGEAVPFIGMIEPGLPEQAWPGSIRLRFLATRLRHHLSLLRGLGPRQMLEYVVARAPPLLGRIGRMMGTSALGKSAYQAEVVSPDLTALIAASAQAYCRYKPRKFQGKVVLFQSALGDPLDCDPLKIWPRHLADFKVVTLPGDHKTILRDANAVLLASGVSGCLEVALAASGPRRMGEPARLEDVSSPA